MRLVDRLLWDAAALGFVVDFVFGAASLEVLVIVFEYYHRYPARRRGLVTAEASDGS
jgi:hypothetical protein